MEHTNAGKIDTLKGTCELDSLYFTFDSTATLADGRSVKLVGAYELNGDTLRLCFRYQLAGWARRPLEFKIDTLQPNVFES